MNQPLRSAAVLVSLFTVSSMLFLTASSPAQTDGDRSQAQGLVSSDRSKDATKDDDDEKLRNPLPKSNAEWKKVLTPEQYNVLRRHGTEKAFTGKYWNTKNEGVYRCAGCGQPVFSSATKFDSGTGWPSYWQPYKKDSIGTQVETKFFVRRIEVHCSRCQGHLGHVFNDGPRPTGLRYCINSAALDFDEELPPVPEDRRKTGK